VPEVDVRLERITKQFGDATAVDDLSLDISEGEFFSMLGPSGCGKTTTLRMIGGFEEATYGTVYLAGRDVTDDPPYKRDVNTVFQSYALFPHLNVFDNVAFGLRRKKVDGSEVDRRVKDIMSLVDLEGFETRKPGQMSGGQQQRVALARALANDPAIVLADEPTGNLDSANGRHIMELLQNVHRSRATTLVLVTHDRDLAAQADAQITMRDGRVV
jgi:spermidine/putrescine transport system ATP-binding protein